MDIFPVCTSDSMKQMHGDKYLQQYFCIMLPPNSNAHEEKTEIQSYISYIALGRSYRQEVLIWRNIYSRSQVKYGSALFDGVSHLLRARFDIKAYRHTCIDVTEYLLNAFCIWAAGNQQRRMVKTVRGEGSEHPCIVSKKHFAPKIPRQTLKIRRGILSFFHSQILIIALPGFGILFRLAAVWVQTFRVKPAVSAPLSNPEKQFPPV